MKNHHVQWVNQLFLWPFSIATLNYLVPMFWISPVSFPWFSLPSRPLWMSSAGAWQVLPRRMGSNDTKGMDDCDDDEDDAGNVDGGADGDADGDGDDGMYMYTSIHVCMCMYIIYIYIYVCVTCDKLSVKAIGCPRKKRVDGRKYVHWSVCPESERSVFWLIGRKRCQRVGVGRGRHHTSH